MRALADTSFFIAEENDRLQAGEAMPTEMADSVITIGELRWPPARRPRPGGPVGAWTTATSTASRRETH
jgi:hypothetical protein